MSSTADRREARHQHAAIEDERTRRAYLAHARHELSTPTDAILGYAEILVEEAQETAREDLLPDLRRIYSAGVTLRQLVGALLDPEYVEKAFAAATPQTDPENIAATIRHDLRTPLNAILGYAEMLIEQVEDDRPDSLVTLVPNLRKLHEAATCLLAQINDIARLSGFGTSGDDTSRSHTDAGSVMVRDAVSSIVALSRAAKPYAGSGGVAQGRVLVVDDNEMNCGVLARQLERQGHAVSVAEGGQRALHMAASEPFDLVLLDVLMPGMNGYQVLTRLKADEALRDIPVIMISSLDELDSVVRCIEMGAEDYLSKPSNPVLLKARIDASLEKKRLRDREKAFVAALSREQEKSERLLLNILPPTIADRLKENEGVIADHFAEATVLFADIVGFTEFSARVPPAEIVDILNRVFSRFDSLAETYDLQKIKTIGDAYMVAAGAPVPRSDHVEATAEMALAIQCEVARLSGEIGASLTVRVGFHTGPVVAGIIGTSRFSYDLWGDTVNLASRMESTGLPGRIQVSASVARRIEDRYHLEERGAVHVKGKGDMPTYFLLGPRCS